MTAPKLGRPAGELHVALLLAAAALRREYAESGRGATLKEIVHRSQVGYAVARRLVPDLKRYGHLRKVGERREPYRNRPVYEYAPVDPVSQAGERVTPFPLAAFFLHHARHASVTPFFTMMMYQTPVVVLPVWISARCEVCHD